MESNHNSTRVFVLDVFQFRGGTNDLLESFSNPFILSQTDPIFLSLVNDGGNTKLILVVAVCSGWIYLSSFSI